MKVMSLGLGWPLDNIVSFAQSNPLLVFAILFFAYNKWKASQPWPDFGGKITKVGSLEDWDTLLKTSGPSKVVVIDAYALWCPPCKSAAPVYAKLSEEFSEESCCFAKVDVDHARDVAQRLEVSAMPTFKVREPATPAFPHASCLFPTVASFSRMAKRCMCKRGGAARISFGSFSRSTVPN